METGYLVREAAGDWWLVDITQSGDPYKKPKRINRTAAEVILMLNDGKEAQEIAGMLHDRYGVNREEAMQDVEKLIHELGVNKA